MPQGQQVVVFNGAQALPQLVRGHTQAQRQQQPKLEFRLRGQFFSTSSALMPLKASATCSSLARAAALPGCCCISSH